MNLCFHCGEPLRDSRLTASIGTRQEPVCCAGCQAVAELIAGAGLGDFYRYREGHSVRPTDAEMNRDRWRVYADPQFASQFTQSANEQTSVTLLIEGLRCSACSWLIDQVLRRLPAVQDASVNAATGRATVTWDPEHGTLADIMRAIAQLGYTPHPVTDETVTRALRNERRDSLKRLAVSGFGMMQVMMFAVAVYSAQITGEVMEAAIFDYFRIVSLLVATPVMFYAGAPILLSAWNSLRARAIGMDVPVSIALVLAYSASVWNTLNHDGEVYFDSVTMFIFFLTLGRFVQMSLRQRTAGVTDALARQLPNVAHRMNGELIEDVAVSSLRESDVILVRRGELLPADGDLLDDHASLDESLLTGESLPVPRVAGERIAAGTLNLDGPIRLRVTAVGPQTALAHIVALLRRAQAQKPAIARRADAAAARFLSYVIVCAGLTAAVWMTIDPSRAFEATLAVLVVACPCAFAIAMPAALASATANLAHQGILVTDADALEALAGADRMIFDKTGTLTRGELRIAHCEPLTQMSETQCLEIAATLERASEHPLARAFATIRTHRSADEVRTFAGRGVEGRIDGRRYRIGSADFAIELRGLPTTLASSAFGSVIVLADEQQILAWFELADSLRPTAPEAVRQLRALGMRPLILSGDVQPAVEHIADQAGIDDYYARRTARQKLEHLQELQSAGHRVAMIGDGVNDAPVLGAADVSIAMGRGAALAHASAGLVLVNENLAALPGAVTLARRTLQIAHQNRLWAAIYNFGSLPLAALGFVPPWVAALGMSLSSIAVVLNATRLLPRNARASTAPPERQLGEVAA